MKIRLKKITGNYLFISGVLAHILVLFVIILQPVIMSKLINKISGSYYTWQKKIDFDILTQGQQFKLEDEINKVFPAWEAELSNKIIHSPFEVRGIGYTTITSAVSALQVGDELFIAPGVYDTPIIITKNNITITGVGHVVFQGAAANEKGFILSQGDNLIVNNIECKNISVRDGNGSCVRQEGINLTLNHVFFHNSQEGVLETAKKEGIINIHNSRFEQLGFNGQAHGIYSNKSSVHIDKSLFIAIKNQGHAIKVRGKKLTIKNSIITSLSADDSRLIDMPNGGELFISMSLLAQGPNSVNGQMIGYGQEGVIHKSNIISLIENIIYLERLGENHILALAKKEHPINIKQIENIVIGEDESNYKDIKNIYFRSRVSLGLPLYPKLTRHFCSEWGHCPIN